MAETEQQNPTDILKWVFTPESIAPCFIKDVYEMRQDSDYYWLGRIPCRSVRIVGIIVGIQKYEKKIVYSVDDGTSVIDCLHQQVTSHSKDEAQPSKPKALAPMGSPITVVGRVEHWHETRRIQVQTIGKFSTLLQNFSLSAVEKCNSANDEPSHWKSVRTLHGTHYFSPDPFVIPTLEQTGKTEPIPRTPTKSKSLSNADSPSPKRTVPPSPHNLRHPSRLPSKELTLHSFRAYIRHFLTKTASGGESSDIIHGVTLSYLRRVPALAEMALRIVKAEAKRRGRELRKKSRETSTKLSTITNSSRPPSQKVCSEPTSAKIKRLFQIAIIQLVQDGSAVIWDGPIMPYSTIPQLERLAFGFRCESANTTTVLDVTVATVTTQGTQASSLSLAEDDDPGELSEPGSTEESYVLVTPEFLAQEVEKAVRLVFAQRPCCTDVSERTIYSQLQRDDRWHFIGQWMIHEGLEFLRDDGKVQEHGGRWKLV